MSERMREERLSDVIDYWMNGYNKVDRVELVCIDVEEGTVTFKLIV